MFDNRFPSILYSNMFNMWVFPNGWEGDVNMMFVEIGLVCVIMISWTCLTFAVLEWIEKHM